MTETVAIDLDAERATLGSVLVVGDPRTASSLMARGLRPDHFYLSGHQDVFHAITSLTDRQAGMDPITVSAEMERMGRASMSREEIDQLAGWVPAAGHFSQYADRVIELARWRQRQAALYKQQQAVARRDELAWQRASSELEVATVGTRTESYSAESWASLLFDAVSLTEEQSREFAIPTPFWSLTEAMGGGIRPGEWCAISGPTSHGKALAVSTPVLTPSGWTTMGDLREGDLVFGADGNPTRVAMAHPVMLGSECYEVLFSDGASVVADGEHLWRYETGERVEVARHEMRSGGTFRERLHRHVERVGSTVDLAEACEHEVRSPRVRLASPLSFARGSFTVDPYVLGVWLGDGTHRSGAVTSSAGDAPEMLRLLSAAGEAPVMREAKPGVMTLRMSRPQAGLCSRGHLRVGRRNRCRECYRDSAAGRPLSAAWNTPLVSRLRDLGVVWPQPKHIPDAYMAGSVEQRLALLQGLVDSDGHVSAHDATVEFGTSSARLYEQVVDLVLGLGGKVRCSYREATRSWRIGFKLDLPAARMERKAARLGSLTDRSRYRYVRSVRAVESVPVRCITVDAVDGMFLAGRSLVPTHNSVFADQWMDSAAKHGKRCHIYMTEMTAITRGMRYLARHTGVPYMAMRRGRLTDQHREKILAELSRIPYGVSIVADWTADDIVRDALRARYDFVCVDLLHGFHYEDERGLDKLSKAMQRLARVSTTLDGHPGTAVLAVTHLKEEGMVRGKIPRPTISSIKGGSSIKQDADFVAFVWQDQEENGQPNGDGEVWLAKGRNGELEREDVRMNPARIRFERRAGDQLL